MRSETEISFQVHKQNGAGNMEKVAAIYGNQLGELMENPEIGQYVAFVDTEGNRLSMLQPSEKT